MNCACQLQSTKIEMAPTRSAAMPSHSMNTPGASTSRTNSTPPAINQSQNPSTVNRSSIETPQLRGFVSELGGSPLAARTLGRAAGRIRARGRQARSGRRARGCAIRISAVRRLGYFRDAGERAEHAARFDRKHQDLLVRRMSDLREGAQVFIGDEIIYGSNLTLG